MKIRCLIGAAAALCTSGLATTALAQPANDQCENAISVAVPSSTSGTLLNGNTEPGPLQTCGTSIPTTGNGVWYTLVGDGNTITVQTCNTLPSFDSKLHVWCPGSNPTPCAARTAWSCIGGSDDTCGALSRVTFCSTAGQVYYVLVSAFSSSGNAATFLLDVTTDGVACSTQSACTQTTAGACCNATTQACTITTSSATCNGGASGFQGIGTSCTYSSPCPGVQACCSSTGTCTVVLPANCTGTSQPVAGTACGPTNPCTPLLGACCSSSGSCSTTTAAGCAGATQFYNGVGSTCSPTNPCTALLGACCNTTSGACTSTISQGCALPNNWQGLGTTCTPVNPCGGSCCNGTVCTTVLNVGACAGGAASFTAGGLCTPNPCSGACCNDTTAVCTTTNPAACGAGSTYKGPGSVCSPTPCPNPSCTPSVPNDQCVNATVFMGTGFDDFGNTTCATTDAMPAVCISTKQDLWWAFTPSVSNNYSIRTCAPGTGASFDTVLSVHTACPTAADNKLIPVVVGVTCPTATNCSCSDDLCTGGIGPSTIPSIALNAGTTYWIRVAVWASTGTPNGAFELVVGELVGSCCSNATGACSVTAQAACPSGDVWTLGQTCTSSTCPGACCKPDGSCVALASSSGCAAGDVFQGNGTLCANVSCPIPTGACCDNNGNCLAVDSSANCAANFPGSTWAGANTTCTPNSCTALLGACCDGVGGCTSVLAAGCASPGTFQGAGTVCSPDPCAALLGACCSSGICSTTTANGCVGTFQSAGSSCTPNPCPQPPANDLCTAAITVSEGAPAATGDNTTANVDAGEVFSCQSSSEAGVWYDFTADADGGTYVFDTEGSAQADTILALFDMCNGSELACDDDGGTTPALSSRIQFVLAANQNVKILLGTYAFNTPGGFVLNITQLQPQGSCCIGTCCTVTSQVACTGTWTLGGVCTPSPCGAPANDNCANAVAISNASLPVTVTGSNCGATTDGLAGSCTTGTANSVWWSFTPTYTGAYTINTCGTSFDTVLTIWSGACGAEVSVGCDDDEPTCSNTLNSQIAGVVLNAGQTYLIRVASFSTGIGDISVTVSGDSASGSCCDGTTCTQTDLANCAFTFTAGGTCTPNPCTPSTGACCCGSNCAVTTSAACPTGPGTNSTWSAGGVCTPLSNTVPCCRGDYNKSGAPPSVQDIFDFLGGYFGMNPCADANDSGGNPSVQDIFDFLAAYFGGC